MSKRLKTRVSAGAALVTGIGMMGIATAAPASAEVNGSLEYTCSETGQNIDFEDKWAVDLTLDIPEKVEQGETIPAGAIDATVTPGADAAEKMQGLGVESLEGTGETTYTFAEDGEERTVELEVPKTDVPPEGEVSVEASGESTEETAPEEDVNAPITAGDFTAELENQDGFVFKIECTAPEDAKVGSVAVGDVEPEAPDEGDDEGGEEEPPAEDDGSGDEGGEEPPAEDDGAGDDAGAGDGEAEVPDVVQTDGAQAAGLDSSLALGGLLLAGAGAGAVVVARRKATQH